MERLIPGWVAPASCRNAAKPGEVDSSTGRVNPARRVWFQAGADSGVQGLSRTETSTGELQQRPRCDVDPGADETA